MWDMKPDLPKEMRSEFQPVATSVPGIRVCDPSLQLPLAVTSKVEFAENVARSLKVTQLLLPVTRRATNRVIYASYRR